MSLHRWSLPSRASAREKSNESDSNQRVKFPTIHIGNPSTRRRANLSSAFANLFEKDENQRLNPTVPDDASYTKELLPLSARIENIPSSSKLNDAKYDVGVHRPNTPVFPTLKRRAAALSLKQDEAPNESHPTFSLNECDPYAKPSRVNMSEPLKSPFSLTRVRSVSSSYPSEGIRSPPEHCRSPQMNTWSESLLSELSPYGGYPSQETSRKPNDSIDDFSAPDDKIGQCLMEELAAAGGISDTDTRTTSRDYTAKPPLSDIALIGPPCEQLDMLTETCYNNVGTIKSAHKGQGLHSSRECGIPSLDGQRSSTSALNGSFPDNQSSTQVSSSEDEFPFRPSNTGSTDRLRLSIEKPATRSARIHWKSLGKAYNTMPASVSRKSPTRTPISSATSHFENEQLSGLQYRSSNGSSTAMAHRIQKFKFRKWIKKVCLRTKVRFDSVIKIEAVPQKTLGKKKAKSQRPRRTKKNNGVPKAKPKSKKVTWKSPKAEKKKEKDTKESGGMAHRFLRSLKKKSSMQLPVQEKSSASHRRVQSCPA
ncbi:hypothetical protein F4804DRAFT_326145 [Jackrogersella minutella]|nr:hypothetical protein F4804DRAFT_326145 [Jackrogersella minutella]